MNNLNSTSNISTLTQRIQGFDVRFQQRLLEHTGAAQLTDDRNRNSEVFVLLTENEWEDGGAVCLGVNGAQLGEDARDAGLELGGRRSIRFGEGRHRKRGRKRIGHRGVKDTRDGVANLAETQLLMNKTLLVGSEIVFLISLRFGKRIRHFRLSFPST
jgi:hypothetical protein